MASAARTVASVVSGVTSIQVGLTLASLLEGLRQSPVTGPAQSDAAIALKAVEAVRRAYILGELDAAACAPDVRYENPFASYRGRTSVRTAFCARHALWPDLVQVTQAEAAADPRHVTLRLSQTAVVGELPSVIHVQLDDTDRVVLLEERWNGQPLLEFPAGFPAFGHARQLNGRAREWLPAMLGRAAAPEPPSPTSPAAAGPPAAAPPPPLGPMETAK